MSSYLDQFNYQFLSGGGRRWTLDEVREKGPETRRWVFLHGLMGYAINWRKIVSLLGPEDLSLIFDQRGHGQSWKPEHGYAPEDYAQDLKKISDEIGWNSFVLVGHSMGGRNALMYAHLYPDSLEKLVIEDIGPDGNDQATSYYERLLGAIPTPFANKLSAKEFFMNEFSQVAAKIPLRGNRQTIGLYLYSNIVDRPDGRADWRFSKQAILDSVRQGRAEDHWREFESLKMPILVIRGAQSEELSEDVFRRMGEANARVRLVQIDNAGHWAHYDQPELFVQALKSFVSSDLNTEAF